MPAQIPSALSCPPHFPSAAHACVWRNWGLVPVERLARVIGAEPGEVLRMGRAMGLGEPPAPPAGGANRTYLTIIKRNWFLLDREQMLAALGWTAAQWEDMLREDIAFPAQLGGATPPGPGLRWREPDAATLGREQALAAAVREAFPDGAAAAADPLFGFIERLSRPPEGPPPVAAPGGFAPNFCHSYFAPYGDFSPDLDPFPDGYLARLRACGVDGVWQVGRLDKLAPFPWEPRPVLTTGIEENLEALRRLVTRAGRQGIGVYLYLNEPRAMPLAFFEAHPELRGVVEGELAALCLACPEVQEYVRAAIAHLCRAVPDLAGIFTISGSENLTHCWSHGHGERCPRCAARGPEVFAQANNLVWEGIRRSGTNVDLIVWDWGWKDQFAEEIIARLPAEAAFMSVSEWDIPLRRGGVESRSGEYSISTVGPGERAQRHWGFARRRGMKVIAKIQANNTWELSAVPHIPAVENVARHAANLRAAGVRGLMFGWTLGGCPSANLEVVAEIGRSPDVSPEEAMTRVAARRYGPDAAPEVVEAWKVCSAAFSEFPFHIGVVYLAPLQVGPANLLMAEPTGRKATMIGFPADDLESWRQVYPPAVFIAQLEKVAAGFERGAELLRALSSAAAGAHREALIEDLGVAEAAAIHFRSAANQASFVMARDRLAAASAPEEAGRQTAELRRVLESEIALARRLHAVRSADSRIGFEAACQYFYLPQDLAEKVLSCRDLLARWLPTVRSRP